MNLAIVNTMNFWSKAYLTKYSILRPGCRLALHQAMTAQYLSSDELESISWSKTKHLLTEAYKYVPYYRTRFKEAGIIPDDIQDPEDFYHIPVLTRNDIRTNFSKLISCKVRSFREFNQVSTGGSTGEPIKVLHDKFAVRAAMLWRMFSWWNVPLGSHFASVYRESRTTLRSKFKDFAIWWPGNHIRLDASQTSAEAIQNFITQFNRYQPPVLHGYAGAIAHLADYILSNDIKVHSPKAVWLTSSPFTRVHQYSIEKAFNSPVYDQYGCCEVFYLAAQCPQRHGLHVFSDRRKVEFLNDDFYPCSPGQYGQIAITDLDSAKFPLIRYINGDRGRMLPEQCKCGRTLPLMDRVKGRISDALYLPNGNTISGEYLTTLFDDFPAAIKQFRLIQNPDYSVVLEVVPNNQTTLLNQALSNASNALIKRLGKEIFFRIHCVDYIAHDKGKLRFIISKIKKSTGGQIAHSDGS